MLFDIIFLTLFFLTWVLLGGVPWLIWSVRRRARGAIWALPFAALGGAGGGALVPLAGLDDGTGVGVSMILALIGGALLTWAAYAAWETFDLGLAFARFAIRADPPSDAPDAAAAGEPRARSIDSGGPPNGSSSPAPDEE